MNPNGKVPVLQIDEHTYLPESNAILCYLDRRHRLWPGDRLARAQALQWMFFEQYSHEPYIAVARFILRVPEEARRRTAAELRRRGYAALAVMDRHLGQHQFFAAERFSIADIALFAYTHQAADGGFDLASYPAVREWLEHCLAQPGVTAMPSP